MAQTALDALVRRLSVAGFAKRFVRQQLPVWLDEEAAKSNEALFHVKLLLAQQLNLDPHSLLDDQRPVSVLTGVQPKFKNLRKRDHPSIRAITAFGIGLARALIAAAPRPEAPLPQSASAIRHAILRSGAPWVSYEDLLALAWSVGIPVVHLRLFPAPAKRMSAMTVRIGDRYAILLARMDRFAATYAFYVAHELGHIALGHLKHTEALVDQEIGSSSDEEEVAADRFAVEVLTGDRSFKVSFKGTRPTASELAERAGQAGPELGVDPGHIILNFAHTTGRWKTAQAALSKLFPDNEPAYKTTNRIAFAQLDLNEVPEDSRVYLTAVLGGRGRHA